MRFLFPLRIGRLSYFIRGIVCSLAFESLLMHFEETSSWEKAGQEPWLLLLGLAIILYWIVFVVHARSRDVGMRWAWLFVLLVPGVNIGLALILLFSKSKPLLEGKEPNRSVQTTALTRPPSTTPPAPFFEL